MTHTEEAMIRRHVGSQRELLETAKANLEAGRRKGLEGRDLISLERQHAEALAAWQALNALGRRLSVFTD